MDTLSFLRAILPPQGTYFLALMQTGRVGVKHIAFTSIEEMAEAAAKWNERPDITVYHACGAYKAAYVMVGDKKKFRIPENTHAAKAFWIDMDCGADKAEKGKGYPSKAEAAKSLGTFCKTTGFPTPFLVDSGNGLHAYWPLTTAIPAQDWTALAATLKASLAHFNVLADPTRTADFASILRPVGSHNKKDAVSFKLVKAKSPLVVYEPTVIMAALSNIISNHDVATVPSATKTASFLDALPDVASSAINDDLLAHAYPEVPADAEEVASKCAQINLMKGEGLGYEHWRGVMGIVKYCEDSDAIAHAWSSLHPLYDAAATQQKLDTWTTPPTTCAFFESVNAAGCEGCAYKGKIKTPLVLGRKEVVQEAQTMAAEIAGVAVQVEMPPPPRGYLIEPDKHVMYRQLKDKDGVMQSHEFCRMIFYPTTRICRIDGTFITRVRAHMPDKTIRDFDVDTGVIASPQELLRVLSQYEVCASTASKDSNMHIHAYMRDSLHRLLYTAQEMRTMTSFGWKNNMESFLIGDRLYCKDGTVRRVVLGGMAAGNSAAFPEPTGTAQGWADGVDFLYNRDDMEPMQYAICSGLGSVLTPLGDNTYHGIPVALTSSQSGTGKTTVSMVSVYAFGDAGALMTNGKDGATINARWGKMSAMNNLPLIFDEMSNAKPADLSALLYGASNGKGKERLVGTKNGVEMAETLTWDMSVFITANNDLGALLASEKGNTEAEAVRVFEIKMDDYDLPKLQVEQVQAATNQIERNMGSAGPAFIQHVVQHLDDVTKKFIVMSERLSADSTKVADQKYRYFRNHAICSLVAAEIMQELGLLKFDMDKLFQWAVSHIARLCGDVEETNVISGQEALNRMITEFGPQIITTYAYRDGRNANVESGHKMSKNAVGRYIMGTTDRSEPLAGRLYLSRRDVKEWCQKNRVPLSLVTDYANTEGILITNKNDNFTLGRGTDNSTGTVRCLCFNLARMQDNIAGVPRLVPTTDSQKEDAA